jgi:hypothetical protein
VRGAPVPSPEARVPTRPEKLESFSFSTPMAMATGFRMGQRASAPQPGLPEVVVDAILTRFRPAN